jgi:hypothetical protein
MLRLKPTWLKNWITEERVPHVRAGRNRGVRFTAAHVLKISSMLPDLLGGHRGAPAAGDMQDRTGRVERPTSGAAGETGGGTGPTSATPARSVIDIAAWSQLRAHRPRHRST